MSYSALHYDCCTIEDVPDCGISCVVLQHLSRTTPVETKGLSLINPLIQFHIQGLIQGGGGGGGGGG